MKRSIWLLTKITPIIILVLLCFTFGCQQPVEEAITEEEAKALLDRYMEIYNEVNLALADEILAPEFVLKTPVFPAGIVGIEALKAFAKDTATMFPDFRCTIEEIFVKGDKIISRFTITGTNAGPLGELPPTGKKFLISSAMAITRVANGKIVEDETFWNVLDLYQQLGFTLAPPQVEEPQ